MPRSQKKKVSTLPAYLDPPPEYQRFGSAIFPSVSGGVILHPNEKKHHDAEGKLLTAQMIQERLKQLPGGKGKIKVLPSKPPKSSAYPHTKGLSADQKAFLKMSQEAQSKYYRHSKTLPHASAVSDSDADGSPATFKQPGMLKIQPRHDHCTSVLSRTPASTSHTGFGRK